MVSKNCFHIIWSRKAELMNICGPCSESTDYGLAVKLPKDVQAAAATRLKVLIVQNVIKEEQIDVLTWTTQSPDLSPIGTY